MICCINPQCQKPLNPDDAKICQSCGSPLVRLRERYRAMSPLGQGGFGRTYLAQDEDRLNSHCVIKQFSPQVQGTKSMEKAIRLFTQEAVRLDELAAHPQIPNLLAYFEQGGFLYLVQQFVEGQSLLQEMRQQGAFNERQIRDVLADVLPVLRFIHKHQVIHRDITPTNILRRKADDRLILIDFGVAKQIDEEASTEQPGTRIGTEGYAPIEQFRGGKAYPASDLYSLGATCLHLLTATRPDNLYDPLNGRWIWREYLHSQGKKPVSDQLAYILDNLLRDLVGDRYQSADEVMRDLNADSFHPPDKVANSMKASSAAGSPPPPQPAPPFPTVRPAAAKLPVSKPPVSKPPVSRPPVSKPLAPSPSASQPPVSQPPVSKPPVSGQPGARPTPLRSGSSRCIQTLIGHSSWVTDIAISQSTPTFASSSLDDKIKIWNLTTGDELLTLSGHTRGVNTIAISPNGRFLVSGSDDYTVKIWNFLNGALLKTLTGHSRDVTAVAISPDGRILVSGGEDRTVRLWDLNTGMLLKVLSSASGMIKSIALSPDGNYLASGGLDNKVNLWSLKTGEPLQTFVGHMSHLHSIAFSPRGQVLATASKDKSIRLWNLQTGDLLRTLTDHTRDVNTIAITADGRTLISGSSDTTIKLWDLTSGRVIDTWKEHLDTVNAIALSPDGKLLISGSSDKTIKIWQLQF
ncbi:MAG: protein kinase [Oscillatoriophycideae cyanobacterium NC_groundwater_1537_Pr4_S-0.65um_50_18]|nr:protein kinase [Oscillatoriophycideae cyanobacterium NC_groundwater_1537_Pr4_S-0.65um_50_18]